ncbi:MAG TPA: SdiA-regulated domain-containing protein [Rhodothermales bacterium]
MNPRTLVIGSVLAFGVVISACGADQANRSEDQPTTTTNAPAESSNPANAPYAFDDPDLSVALPDELREVSGISALPDGRIAAVQDEEGIIFLLNPETGAVELRETFGEPADYEGIAWADDRIFVLRSNGRLFEITQWPEGSPRVMDTRTPLRGKNDTEGLAYDARNGRLLIACKEEPGAGLGEDAKAIYAFDLTSRSLSEEPVFVLRQDQIESQTPLTRKFKPSAVALHPITGDLYVLSSTASGIVVVGADGTLKNGWSLSSSLYEQPEGLTFLPDGTLFISSEGGDGPAMLYRYAPNAN